MFSLNVTEDGKQALITLSGGDMRKVLNVLQSTWLAFGAVTEENVYSCVGHPLPIDIKNIVNWLFNESYELCYCSILFFLLVQIIVCLQIIIFLNTSSEIQDIKLKKGLALQDILTELHLFINKSMFLAFKFQEKKNIIHYFNYFFLVEFPDSILIDLIIKLAEIEKRVSIGCSEAVQLNALVSAFQNARDIET